MKKNSQEELSITLNKLEDKKEELIEEIKENKQELKEIKYEVLKEKDTISKLEQQIKKIKEPKKFNNSVINGIIISKMLNTLFILLVSAIGFCIFTFAQVSSQKVLGVLILVGSLIFLFRYYQVQIKNLKPEIESVSIQAKRLEKNSHVQKLAFYEENYFTKKEELISLNRQLNRVETKIKNITDNIEFIDIINKTSIIDYSDKLVHQ